MIKSTAILVPKDAKCPVCGMFVAKYPKWAAEVKADNHSHYFDGVKDMMKWYFSKNKDLKNIYVTDYYTTNKIDAKTAFYVIGSNVYGPMGNELIPFNSKEKAKKFKRNHVAKKIIKFDQITLYLVKSL
jgi:nitrous oxide reductase accessory protein NosL